MKTPTDIMNESNLRILDMETSIREAITQNQARNPAVTDAETNCALLKILTYDNQVQLREERAKGD